ncbi:hypothetical protein AMS68_001637 [Peltaster fructicola]|uniref:Uncharacterized protein n=1 Tax=Peltaster fructicola TaxID=286661 RepID=A0A6H0XNQ9_9PEZI|nr:hypothetical protein AMS68_001637 [Peltaster fructicola]
MADVVVGLPHHNHDDSIATLEAGGMRTTAPAIEMVRNPAFSFPMKPLTPSVSNEVQDAPRRPMSMLLQPASSSSSHKRTASALPTFTFNASDTSGRLDDTPPQTPDENMMSSGTPVRKGHRRGGSEFVGGDSRFGVNNAITTSPTKLEAPLLPEISHSPGRRHAHRRSVAVSSHDLSHIMSAGNKSPRLSSSLPSSPLDMPTLQPAPIFTRPTITTTGSQEEQHHPQLDESPVRPPSRPRVEFVEQVEIIPRPLSTISSETESSVSTVIGHHSLSNSINSVLSLGSPASAAHARKPSGGHVRTASVAEPCVQHRSSIEISKRVEKEGEWLKSRSSPQEQSPISEPASATQLTIEEPQVFKRQKRLSHGFGLDRRRSEPLISATTTDYTRLSALSLQEAMIRETARPSTSEAFVEKRSSGQKLKQWALSKLHRRHSKTPSQPLASALRSESAESVDVPGKVSISRAVVAETDLDAVFGNVVESSPPRFAASPTQITFESASPMLESSRSSIIDLDADSPLVDLDAALGSTRTTLSGSSHRRHMHSDRPLKATSATSGFLHRRAESEPVLMAFNYNRAGSNAQKSMEDVFEEDEEDHAAGEAGMGITMVDADRSAFDPANPESQRLRRAARDSDRPSTSYMSSTSQLVVATPERPASLVDDVITEESTMLEPSSDQIEIVEAHEEPRAASLEKSSDSSEASTLLGLPTLALPDDEALSPETCHSSSFSSPDFTRRQGSFEASRVGTSASSITDTRTTSSCTTGEGGHEVRISVDDVPSLTSSRSTMISTIHANNSRRDVAEPRVYEAVPRLVDPAEVAARRKKRASIQSLSQLVGGTFGSKSKHDESRPQTATLAAQVNVTKKKEHRLKKLMFWRSKQNLRQAAADASN